MEQTRKNLTDFFKNSDFGEELLTSYLNYLVFNNFDTKNLKSIEETTDDELNKFKEYLFNVYKYNDFKDNRQELIKDDFALKFYNRSYTEEYLKTKFYSHRKLNHLCLWLRELLKDFNNYFIKEDEYHPREYSQEQVDKEVRENPEFLKMINYFNRFEIEPERFFKLAWWLDRICEFNYKNVVRFMAYNIAEDFFTKYPQELKELELKELA